MKGFQAYVMFKKYKTYYNFFGLKVPKFWPHGNRSIADSIQMDLFSITLFDFISISVAAFSVVVVVVVVAVVVIAIDRPTKIFKKKI